MELPPSYEEAIQQPVEPFDNSSVGNFYRQVLMLLQLPCFDELGVMQQMYPSKHFLLRLVRGPQSQ